MGTPFDSASSSIPVTVVTDATALQFAEPCAARGDIRALLFDLLQKSREPGNNPLISVVVDASDLRDPKPVIDRLERGVIPAFGLRDHTVARSFHLSRVI